MARLNQRMCRVVWHDGEPGIEVGRVTKVMKTSFHVNGKSARNSDWFTSWKPAIREEYEMLFFLRSPIFARRHIRASHSVPVVVGAVCRLRRLECRIQARSLA